MNKTEQVKHNEDANVYINRAIEMLKDEYRNEPMIAGYNGIVSLLTYAKESHSRTTTPPNQLSGIEVEEMAKAYAQGCWNDAFNDGGQAYLSAIEAFKAGYAASEGDKDLIIQGLEEGSELWKAEYDNCRAILTELVYLKTLKDTKGKTEEYEQRQPLVWITAKKFLEKYQHQ